MFVTLWCITVILISMMAVGVPLRWLLGGRKPLNELAWIEAPFLGIAVIALVLQNLIYLDIPVRLSAPVIWIGVLLLWIYFYRSGQLRECLRACPLAPFAGALFVYLFQGIGLLVVGARYYVGKAWADQFNYTSIAQLFIDDRFSLPLQEVGNRPYLVPGIVKRMDRIGFAGLHGFFAVSSFQDAKTLFEPMILLSPALIVLAIYALGRRFGLERGYAVAAGVVAGVMPAITAVHLESFLAQALAIPFLLVFPVMLHELSERPDWSRLSIAAIVIAATTSIYTELWIILLGLAILILGIAAFGHRYAWRLLACCAFTVIAPFALSPLSVKTILNIFNRVGAPVLGNVYPWALQVEGLGRLWLGDLVGLQTAAGIQPRLPASLVWAVGLGATALAYYGLASVCLPVVFGNRAIWADPQRRRGFAFASGVLMLALLPMVVVVRDREHPYQFYKLLLSVSPLFALGLALLREPAPPAPASDSGAKSKWAAWLQVIPVPIVLGVMFLFGAWGTTSMVWQSTKDEPVFRSATHLILTPETRQLQEQLESMKNQKLFIYSIDTTWSGAQTNAWLSYFARNNQVWLGNPIINDVNIEEVPQLSSNIDISTLPSDALFLHDTRTALLKTPGATQGWQLVWSSGPYQLMRPSTDEWAVIYRIQNANGINRLDDISFWMGKGDTTIEVLASKAGMLQLGGTFLLGPSVPELSRRTLFINNNKSYQTQVVLTAGDGLVSVPVQAGLNKIMLRPLDVPTIAKLDNGDTRPLVLGIRDIHIQLDTNSVAVGRLQDTYATEQVYPR
jgi:hypothetical protein